jgi:prolyl-tRNA editing enzyme YbaK/EbsC (Cys-tRNA(Pro) deacylase)
MDTPVSAVGPSLAPSALKVQGAADRLGLAVIIRQMPGSTRTAEEAAAACGCDVGQIVKSLVFAGAASGKPYLLLVSGRNRVAETSVLCRRASPGL